MTLPIVALLALTATTPPSGKDLFVARCGSCHNERGDKPLPTGLPLNERKLSPEAIAKAVRGRMKQSPAADQRAVAEYITSFQQAAH